VYDCDTRTHDVAYRITYDAFAHHVPHSSTYDAFAHHVPHSSAFGPHSSADGARWDGE
jgi:hypothetical protein